MNKISAMKTNNQKIKAQIYPAEFWEEDMSNRGESIVYCSGKEFKYGLDAEISVSYMARFFGDVIDLTYDKDEDRWEFMAPNGTTYYWTDLTIQQIYTKEENPEYYL